MDILRITSERAPELAEYLQEVARQPLSFEGDHPIDHSCSNHAHLWMLEQKACEHDWIDLEYRTEFIKYIFERWRTRLRGLPPYHDRGYRMYLYEEFVPTISVVAETDHGFPYPGGAIFVKDIVDIMKLYTREGRTGIFNEELWKVSPEAIVKAVTQNNGSISKPTAGALGVKVGELRKLIINMGLDYTVNQIRKKHKRRPADFSNRVVGNGTWRVYERRLPPNYK